MKNTLSALLLAGICTCALSCKTEKCIENPKADCVCTMQYDPVCGCNNKTYSNACAAQCAGITKYKKGECPK